MSRIKLFHSINLAILPVLIGILGPDLAFAERVKDLAAVQGVRQNQLIGYGMVSGLEGTGDQTPFTNQTVLNMLQQMGVNLPPGTNPKSKNIAAVMVTGNLPAFAQPGQTLDVTVSSIGTAKSIRGGTLLMTPLKGADGQIYAIAQGNLTTQGSQAAGGNPQADRGKPSVILDGATVEQAVNSPVGDEKFIKLELKANDFGIAGRIVDAVNYQFGFGTAQAENGRVIKIRAPLTENERVAFIGQVENLDVTLDPVLAKVVFNQKTGAVVMNQAVTLDECAVTQGDISLVVTANQTPGAPVADAPTKLMMLSPGVLLAEVVKALNEIGASPQDLLAILQSMKRAGALHAELELI